MLIVEGPRLLAEALAASVVVREVYAEQADAWPGATLVRPGTLARSGDVQTSQGVLAVVDAPPLELGGPSAPRGLARRGGLADRGRRAPLVVVLVDVADPGNAGTVLRSAEAAGAAAVLFAGRGVDPTSPKVVRAAAGALFRVPVAVTADVAEALAWLDDNGLRSWATVVDGGEDLYTASFDGPTAVLFGSEAHGLPASVLEHPGMGRLSIPMAGATESLNVAMAVTVTAFELWRRVRTAAAVPPAPAAPGQ